MIKYRNADINDMQAVAKTHITCFPDYFLTKLDGGNGKLLSKFYQSYLQNDAFFVVAEDEGEIVGFVMGFIIPNAAREKFEKENFWLLASRFARLLLRCNKMAWERVIEKIKSVLKKEKNHYSEFTNYRRAALLSIAVKADYRGTGIAVQLVEEFEKQCRERDVDYYTLSALVKNARGNSFYKKLNFNIKEIYEDKHNTHYYKVLNKQKYADSFKEKES